MTACGALFSARLYVSWLAVEAVRGTGDPGYFAYTLGKLEILALRDQVGGDLRGFHDCLLASGTPPPAIVARHLLPS